MKDTKELILHTAYNKFLYNNYEAVTINSIIQETGLTKGAIYHYFASKEEIFKAVVDKYMLETKGQIEMEFDTLKDFLDHILVTVKNRLATMLMENTSFTQEVPINYLSLIVSAHRYYPNYAAIAKEYSLSTLKRWEMVIDKAIKSGEIKADIDREAVMNNFITIGPGIVHHLIIGGSLGYACDMFERQFRSIYDGIKN
jgi:AcrR family transcriptional regulator